MNEISLEQFKRMEADRDYWQHKYENLIKKNKLYNQYKDIVDMGVPIE